MAAALAALAGAGAWRRGSASSEAADNHAGTPVSSATREINRDQWKSKLRDAGVEDSLSSKLADLVRPSVALQAQPFAEDLPIGCSKLGGRPDLPPGMAWPTRQPYSLVYPRGDRSVMQKERPLAFLAQINLSDIAAAGGTNLELPQHGLLSLFYDAESQPWGFDPGDSVGFQLMWFAEPDLRPSKPPESLAARFKSVALSPQARDCVPPPDTFAVSQILNQSINQKSTRTQLDDIFSRDKRDDFLTSGHALGGWPCPIQGEMETECQLVTNGIFCGLPEGYTTSKAKRLRPGASDWRLILQLDSDERAGWIWGDDGKIYVWMREQDVRARRFDRCWTILQCY
jgi:uncharacterized protein YwqG